MVEQLDALVGGYVEPVMQAAGFTRRDRQFRRYSALGDCALLAVRSAPSTTPDGSSRGDDRLRFYVCPAIAPVPLQRFHRFDEEPDGRYAKLPPQQEHTFQLSALDPPERFRDEVVMNEWVADWPAEQDDCGEAVREVLVARGIPLLQRLLVRDELLAAVRANESQCLFSESSRLHDELLCQLDRVPVEAARAMLTDVLAAESGFYAQVAERVHDLHPEPAPEEPFLERFSRFVTADLETRPPETP